MFVMSGHSSVGRVQASQAWCREFESRCPLQCVESDFQNPLTGFRVNLEIVNGVIMDVWVMCF